MIKILPLIKILILFCCLYSTASLNAQQFGWVKAMGGGIDFTHHMGNDIATDATGNVYTVGIFKDATVDFDPGTGVANQTSVNGRVGDAFITKFDASGNFLWVKTLLSSSIGYNSNSGVTALSIALDQAGNIYVSGAFKDTVDFNPGTGVSQLFATGNPDAFLVKLNASAGFVWAKSWGGTSGYEAAKIAVDALGNIYCGGGFGGNVDFDPGPGLANRLSNGENDVFISKFDSSGNFIWVASMGGEENDGLTSIAVDATGSVYSIGPFQDIVDFDPGSATAYLTAALSEDNFISKLDSSGNFVWAKSSGGSSVNSLAVDAWSNVYIAGQLFQSTDVDPGPGVHTIVPSGMSDGYVCKLDTAGNFVWANQVGGAAGNFNSCGSVTIDMSGNPYVAGVFSGITDFDPDLTGTLTLNAINGRVFIQKLNALGELVWVQNMAGGATNGSSISSQCIDPTGNIYSTGSFRGSNVDFDPNASVSSVSVAGTGNGTGIFVHKMSCPSVTEDITVTACGSYNFFGTALTQSGAYSHVIINAAAGCDSIVSLNLTIPVIDTSVTKTSGTLKAVAGATYQWINCGNGNAVIPGATAQSYTPSVDGSYAVAITLNGCSDTSNCHPVTVLAIRELGSGNMVSVFPSPTDGKLTLRTDRPLRNAGISLINMPGQKLLGQTGLNGTTFTFDITRYSPGIYFMEIAEQGKIVRIKLVKQ